MGTNDGKGAEMAQKCDHCGHVLTTNKDGKVWCRSCGKVRRGSVGARRCEIKVESLRAVDHGATLLGALARLAADPSVLDLLNARDQAKAILTRLDRVEAMIEEVTG